MCDIRKYRPSNASEFDTGYPAYVFPREVEVLATNTQE